MPFISNGSIKINYDVKGDPRNEPLVLLHWFMGSHKTWFDISWVRTLQNHFYLILIDHRGYGKSSKPHEPEAYHPKNHVSDIQILLDRLNIDDAHFMGYSMGGRIAFAIAVYSPDLVNSLVIGGMHPYKKIPTDMDERISLLKNGMRAILDAYDIAPKIIYKRMLNNDSEALLADSIQTKNWPGFGDKLQDIDQNTLIFVGIEDDFYEGAKRAATQMPNATFVAFPSESHRTAFTKKRLLLPHLKRFYNRNLEY